MGSVGSDELLVARQADDGGAGELLRRDRAAGGRRGVGQVPRRHGLEEPLGRRRACGRAGRRRWRAVARVGVDGVRWGPLATHRVPRERDAKTPRRGSTSRRREDEQRAKGHRKRTGQRGDDVDEAQRPQRGQAPARSACASRRRYEEGRGRETARETKTGRLLAAPSPPAGSTPGPRVSRRPARSSAGSRRPTPHRWRWCPSWAASSWTRPCAHSHSTYCPRRGRRGRSSGSHRRPAPSCRLRP